MYIADYVLEKGHVCNHVLVLESHVHKAQNILSVVTFTMTTNSLPVGKIQPPCIPH